MAFGSRALDCLRTREGKRLTMQHRHRRAHLRLWVLVTLIVGAIFIAAVVFKQERPPFAHEVSSSLNHNQKLAALVVAESGVR